MGNYLAEPIKEKARDVKQSFLTSIPFQFEQFKEMFFARRPQRVMAPEFPGRLRACKDGAPARRMHMWPSELLGSRL